MKKYIPAPIKESLRFHAEPKADGSSSTSKKDWEWSGRNVKFKAGDKIASNHPSSRSGHADEESELS